MKSFPLLAFVLVVMVVAALVAPSQKVRVECPPVESSCVAYAEAPNDFGQAISMTGQKVVEHLNVSDPRGSLRLTLKYRTLGGTTKTQRYFYKEDLLDPRRISSISGVKYAYARDKKGNIVATADIR